MKAYSLKLLPACSNGEMHVPGGHTPTQSHKKHHQRPFVPNSGVDGVVKGVSDDSHLEVENKQDTLDTHEKYINVFNVRQNVYFRVLHWFHPWFVVTKLLRG